MTHLKILAGAVGASLLLGLTACTTTSSDSAPTPSSTATTNPSPLVPHTAVADEKAVFHPDEKTTTSCEHGKAVIDENSAEVTLTGDCDTVTVKAGNTIVHLGTVEHLIVDGNINRVEVASVDEITVTKTSKKNDVVYGGSKPTIRDSGLETAFEASAKGE